MGAARGDHKASPNDARRVRGLARTLARWYGEHARDLPWRRTRDPYRIWLSEIMCQQTQVGTVVPYFERFTARFPDLESLAEANEEEVLEYWAGLGYYSRGRNLSRAARAMIREHSATVPNEPEALRQLPGVGEYTAAAIGSIAFDHRVAVVDGNVERVLARVLGIEQDPKRGEARRRLAAAAAAAVPPANPGDHNQAMMELGATVCTPRGARCHACPIRRRCEAHARGLVDAIPPPRRRRMPEDQHWLAVVITHPTRDETHLLVRDETLPFLAGQWGVPLLPLPPSPKPDPALPETARRRAEELLHGDVWGGRERGTVRHGITYRRLQVHVVQLAALDGVARSDQRWGALEERSKLAGLYRKIIEHAYAPLG
ncbi:MAG: A/G-specific adenine glycosylase [Planctomycetes bacterium]|nr:A/G-specific adenine glycosylase [Planctomycetota bacterium]